MEIAYDHVQEAVIEAGDTTPRGGKSAGNNGGASAVGGGLNAEFEQAYKVISASPWGMKFGGFLGAVKKQSESYYEAASKHQVTEQATRGFTDLKTNIINRTRSLSLTQAIAPVQAAMSEISGATSSSPSTSTTTTTPSSETTEKGAGSSSTEKEGVVGSPTGEGFISKLKENAAKRIAEIEKVEQRADEYLLRFGTTIGNFLKEAVTIAPPEGGMFREIEEGADTVLFESKGTPGAAAEDGKRQIYTTRLDAQLHLLHTSIDLFKLDPAVESFKKEWSASFDADKRTEQIALDLEKYPELRASMEKLVPDSVKYEDFWKRYYFLRAELDSEEQKRKELLKGALEEEEVGWDNDSEDEDATTADGPKDDEDDDEEGVEEEEEEEEGEEEEEEEEEDDDDDEDDDDNNEEENEEDDEEDEDEEEDDNTSPRPPCKVPRIQASNETLQPLNKPKSSLDRTSQPDSDTSYDIVSGAPSKTPSQAAGSPPQKKKDDESDDEDWE